MRFQIVRAVSICITVFWDMTPCMLEGRYKSCEATCYLYLLVQSWRWKRYVHLSPKQNVTGRTTVILYSHKLLSLHLLKWPLHRKKNSHWCSTVRDFPSIWHILLEYRVTLGRKRPKIKFNERISDINQNLFSATEDKPRNRREQPIMQHIIKRWGLSCPSTRHEGMREWWYSSTHS